LPSTRKEKIIFWRKVLLFTVPGKEVGQEASKDGQEAVGHSIEYCYSLYLAKRSAGRPARMARRLLDTVLREKK
jgi:hypothetical protein